MDVRIESFDPNGQKSVRECRFTEVHFRSSFHLSRELFKAWVKRK